MISQDCPDLKCQTSSKRKFKKNLKYIIVQKDIIILKIKYIQGQQNLLPEILQLERVEVPYELFLQIIHAA